jgi:hypothetical protein
VAWPVYRQGPGDAERHYASACGARYGADYERVADPVLARANTCANRQADGGAARADIGGEEDARTAVRTVLKHLDARYAGISMPPNSSK